MMIFQPAESLAQQAKQAYQHNDYQTAAQLYQQAADLYREQQLPLPAAEMRNNASVAWLQAGVAEHALAAVQDTDQVFAEAGDIRRQGLACGNLGAALEALGRLDESQEAYQRSADLLKQAGDFESRLPVMQALSALQLRTGKQMQAVATMQAGLQGIQRPNPVQRLLKRLLEIPSKIFPRS